MITIKNLDFSYKKKSVFNDLNLEINSGQICGLFGKNGAGKTTLLYCISGLLFPQNGYVSVLNYSPQKRQPSFLSQIFIVPEEFYLPGVPIKTFVKNNASFYPHFNQEEFDKYLNDFDIPVNNKLDEMSYGQKKKVLISFALASNTPVVLLDEPTNGLDIVSKSQFKKVIAGITDNKKAIIISTHQVKDLENLIERVIIMDETNIIFDKTLEEIGSKLQFKLSFDKGEKNEAIYTEESITGTAVVMANTGEEESKIDLEMLYKSVVTNRKTINNIFNNQ